MSVCRCVCVCVFVCVSCHLKAAHPTDGHTQHQAPSNTGPQKSAAHPSDRHTQHPAPSTQHPPYVASICHIDMSHHEDVFFSLMILLLSCRHSYAAKHLATGSVAPLLLRSCGVKPRSAIGCAAIGNRLYSSIAYATSAPDPCKVRNWARTSMGMSRHMFSPCLKP